MMQECVFVMMLLRSLLCVWKIYKLFSLCYESIIDKCYFVWCFLSKGFLMKQCYSYYINWGKRLKNNILCLFYGRMYRKYLAWTKSLKIHPTFDDVWFNIYNAVHQSEFECTCCISLIHSLNRCSRISPKTGAYTP